MGNLLNGFNKINVTLTNPKNARFGMVWIPGERGQIHNLRISASFNEELNWKHGERVDIMNKGKTIAIVPNRVGIFKVSIMKGSTMCIYSTAAALKVASITEAHTFKGWVEDDVLFFKPVED